MNLPQLLSAAVDGAGAAAEPLNIPGMDGDEQTGGEGSGGDSATCTRSGDTKGPWLRHSQARPAHVGSRGCSPRVKFYQRPVPVEQGVPSGGWVTGQELSSLEPVQSRLSGGRRNNPMEREEGRCFRETLKRKVCWGATFLEMSDTCNGTGSK